MPTVKSSLRAALLGGAVAASLSSAALAADKPATPEGAKQVADVIASIVGKPQLAAVTVKPEGSRYAVSFDIAAMNPTLAASGVSYDPATVKLDVFEQDDGAWRFEEKGLPTISGHVQQTAQAGGRKMDFTLRIDDLQYTLVYDPTLGWARSGHGSHSKGAIDIKGPGLAESIALGPMTADLTTKVGADGRVASALEETLGALGLTVDVDPHAASPDTAPSGQPVHIAAKAEGAKVSVRIEDLAPHPLLNLWSFYVAHPTRPALAVAQDQLKSLLNGALADHAVVNETLSADKLTVDTPKGPFAFEGASVEIGGANKGAGSGFSERFAARGLTLPAGLVPAMFKALVPTTFDLGFEASGFDLASAGAEWIADLHLAGDGPVISKEDQAKVGAKLLGSGPIVVKLTPMRVDAPSLSVSIDGHVSIDNHKPTGKLTLKARDFDKTIAALQALGPDAQRQLTPVIAMAKGLAKTDANGVSTWVGEVGADKVLKVNGLPLGKSPF